MRVALAILGVLFMVLGFEALGSQPWFGWMDVSLGVLAILSFPKASLSVRYLIPLGPLGVGAGAMILCIGGVLWSVVPSSVLWATLALGLFSLLLGSLTVTLPTARENERKNRLHQ